MINISLTKDFSKFPFGMEEGDGDSSGFFFRKNILLPTLNESDETITIVLDNTWGLGSSFIIGAFSLIIKEINPKTNKNYTTEEVEDRVIFTNKCTEGSEIDDIWKYMREIEKHSYPNHKKNPCRGDIISYLNENHIVDSISPCGSYALITHSKFTRLPIKDCILIEKAENY